MLKRFQLFLGPQRFRIFIALLGLTGLLSLILNAIQGENNWVVLTQTALLLVFITGAVWIVGGRMAYQERLRWGAILMPAIGLVVAGVIFFPDLFSILFGGAFGWILVGLFIFRGSRGPIQYKQAIRYMRTTNYAEAVKSMDELIQVEPHEPNHYRFRAELLRLWGKLDRAKRDYIKMTELDSHSAVGYNGIAEVCLQAANYDEARRAALKAYELAPDEWVAVYNLGMIEDRLKASQSVVEHLEKSLSLKIPDTRHRLLVYLYLARAYSRLGEFEKVPRAVMMLKKQRDGLEEWQLILNSNQAEALRNVLEEDIKIAQALADDKMDINVLATT